MRPKQEGEAEDGPDQWSCYVCYCFHHQHKKNMDHENEVTVLLMQIVASQHQRSKSPVYESNLEITPPPCSASLPPRNPSLSKPQIPPSPLSHRRTLPSQRILPYGLPPPVP
jgi:hypothetical protein